MKITYTAPNRSHHYPYAEALYNAGHLHAFVSGYSRFSPLAPLPAIGSKLKRHDIIQNLYIGFNKIKAPELLKNIANGWSNMNLDRASFRWAKNSDVFIYYRTQGHYTTKLLRKNGIKTISVLEEVNSHVEFATEILKNEYDSLQLRDKFRKDFDYDLRIKSYNEADAILCPSEFVKNSFILKGFSEEQLIKVNFGFPPILDQKKVLRNTDKTFRLLYVGQLHYRKGLRYAIDAFKRFNHPNKEFVIVGPKTSVTGLERTSIPKEVIFKGALKGNALIKEFSKATVFILPSLEEGLALVQGEALSMGIPLLITCNTGGQDLIKNGVEGFIVPAGQVDSLLDCFYKMADNKDLLNSMSEAALLTARKLGSWDRSVSKLVQELNRFL